FQTIDESDPKHRVVLPTTTVYRLGSQQGRIEETPAPGSKQAKLVVVNGKDLWMRDRADATGQHLVDTSTHLAFRAPLLPEEAPASWSGLEVGCEVAFLKARGATVNRTAAGSEWTLSADGLRVTLTTDASGRPKELELRGNGMSYRTKYLDYQVDLPADPSRFAKPPGKFVESSGRPAPK
ncbi:MAG TPA: hypothetical protein VGE98_16760, partial [Thermoanaerobaculia bacterium]